MIKLLGLDFETQGFPAETTNVTEVGAVLVGLPLGGAPRMELGRLSTFCWDSSYPAQSSKIVALTGITDADLKDPNRSVTPGQAYRLLLELVEEADVIMCHNVSFDKAVFIEQAKRHADTPPPEKEWFCSLRDVQYAERFTCKKLSHLALDHGVKMDGRKLHRATADVELMFDLVLDNYDLRDLLAYKKLPKLTMKIDIPKPWTDGEKGKNHAVSLGYAFDRDKSVWVKPVLEKDMQAEVENAKPYRASVLA